RHAAQQAALGGVGGPSLLQCQLAVEMRPRFHRRLALGNAVEAGAYQPFRSERAAFDGSDGFAGTEWLHGSAPVTQAATSSSVASSCWRPTSWIPTGSPFGPRVKGKVTQGIQR